MPRRHTVMVGVVALILGVSVGATMIAWATDSEESEISGCYSNHSGALRVVASGELCRQDETAISWNRQGPPGPVGRQGEQGPIGPQGLEGPEGPAGGLAGREVVSLGFTVPQSTFEFTYVATAECPAGKVVLGGGYEIEQAGVNEFRESHPEVVQPGVEGWSVGVGPDDDVDVDGVVYAICVTS
jgi:hypothetical protein